MKLTALEYIQFEGQNGEWTVKNCTFDNINLIVGKNSSGKSRILNVISCLASLIAGERKPTLKTADYHVTFEDDSDSIYKYRLKIENAKVVEECLELNSNILLQRGNDGSGTIFAKQLNVEMNFQSPVTELASHTRRDSVQHPFFDGLFNWAKALRFYHFGSPLGKDNMAIFKDKKEADDATPIDLKEEQKVIAIFKKGTKEFANKFTDSIIKDMAAVGYSIEEIGIGAPKSVILDVPAMGLFVKEKDLNDITDQLDMSQGMFRALSLIIQITYSQLKGFQSCLLIDDIGEGLDFERAANLIKLLIDKAGKSYIQLIMSTNDRFIMNNVPIKYWCVAQRERGVVRIYNYKNSKEVFDEFDFTGLNNFDFFSNKFYEKGFKES